MSRVFVAIGACSVGAGLAVVFALETIPSALWAILAGFNRLSVVTTGLLAMALAFVSGAAVVRSRTAPATPAAPADRRPIPVPGSDFDAALVAGKESAVRERLRVLAVAALVSRGSSRTEAEAAVDRGTWTDDGVAAWFVGSGVPTPGLRYRLSVAFRRESAVARHVRRTVRAIESHRGGGGDG